MSEIKTELLSYPKEKVYRIYNNMLEGTKWWDMPNENLPDKERAKKATYKVIKDLLNTDEDLKKGNNEHWQEVLKEAEIFFSIISLPTVLDDVRFNFNDLKIGDICEVLNKGVGEVMSLYDENESYVVIKLPIAGKRFIEIPVERFRVVNILN